MTMVGADYSRGPLTLDLSVGRTAGLGEYRGRSGGRMNVAMTGVYPWAGYGVNERVAVWAVTGYGRGGLHLAPNEGGILEAGMAMGMTAVGGQGDLVGSTTSAGFALAFKADALGARPPASCSTGLAAG